LAGAGKVVGPILRVAGVVGDFFAIVAGGIEALFNIEDYFSGDKSIFSFVTNTFIAPLAEVIGGKGASDKLKGAAESLDKDIKNAIGGPMDWLNTVAGPGFTKAVQNALGPIGQTMRDLFKGDVLKNITDLITQPFKDLLKDGPVEHTKRGFDKLWDYLTPIGKMIEDRIKGIKIPNLMELIFGKKDNKDNPVDKFINDIKTKIAGFIPWLQSIKLPSILDLLFGNTGKKDKNTANPVDKFIADIKAKIGGLKAWLLTNIPKAPSINWKPLSQGLQDVYSWVTKKYNDLKNWIKTHTPKIPTLSWGNLTTGLKKAVDWVQGKFNDLLNFLKGLPKKMKDFGKKIMQGLADGLAEKFKAVKDILKYISDHFPKSPPKTGPLSEVTPENMYLFGGSLGSGLSEGLDSKTNQVFNNLGNANGVLYNAPTSAAAVNDNSSSDINIDKVEVTVPESVGSKEEAYLYGQSAASGLVDELKGQATNAGILSR
ncbi:MAG: hypothetical protein Q7U45_01085, partial [Burkholderiaceae bacterium]|nr:hypothetical protein [Burkholderiaceae bacterium]